MDSSVYCCSWIEYAPLVEQVAVRSTKFAAVASKLPPTAGAVWGIIIATPCDDPETEDPSHTLPNALPVVMKFAAELTALHTSNNSKSHAPVTPAEFVVIAWLVKTETVGGLAVLMFMLNVYVPAVVSVVIDPEAFTRTADPIEKKFGGN